MALEKGYSWDLIEVLSGVGKNLARSGLSILPETYARMDPKKAEKELAKTRLEMGLSERYEVSSKAMEELEVILKETGFVEFLEKVGERVKESKESVENY